MVQYKGYRPTDRHFDICSVKLVFMDKFSCSSKKLSIVLGFRRLKNLPHLCWLVLPLNWSDMWQNIRSISAKVPVVLVMEISAGASPIYKIIAPPNQFLNVVECWPPDGYGVLVQPIVIVLLMVVPGRFRRPTILKIGIVSTSQQPRQTTKALKTAQRIIFLYSLGR